MNDNQLALDRRHSLPALVGDPTVLRPEAMYEADTLSQFDASAPVQRISPDHRRRLLMGIER